MESPHKSEHRSPTTQLLPTFAMSSYSSSPQPGSSTPEKLRRTVQAAGSFVSRLNIGKWIDNLEQNQKLADELEEVNDETADLSESKQLVAEVRDMCMETIRRHLDDYIRAATDGGEQQPATTYDGWIQSLHPDNVTSEGHIDGRFYVNGSDHLRVWNEAHRKVPSKQVVPRPVTDERGLS